MFYFIRHGETGYTNTGKKIYKGFGENFAPLTIKGIEQIKKTSIDIRLAEADIIVSSPYTRALQSAAILSKELSIDIAVEPNLFEWCADREYIYQPYDVAECRCREFNEYNGDYPIGEERSWEDNKMLKARLQDTLCKYLKYNKVIVVCHGMLIHSIYQEKWLKNGEILELDIKGVYIKEDNNEDRFYCRFVG